MPEAEFGIWCRYFAQRRIPHRRLELLLANVARIVDASMGGRTNLTLADYLFDPKPEEEYFDDED